MWFVIEWPFEDFTKHDLFLSNIQGFVKWSCHGDSACLLIITNMFPHILGNANHLFVPWMAALSCLLVWDASELLKGTSLAWEFWLLFLKLGKRNTVSVVNLTPWEQWWKMRGENGSVQNHLILEKVMGIMDILKMFCVVLILAFPRR